MKPILLKSLLLKERTQKGFIDLSHYRARELIKRDCSEILKAYQSGKATLYRGESYSDDVEFGIIDPRNTIRPSRNTNNITTAIIAQSEAWRKEGIPLRHRSIIMSTSTITAGSYGTLYEVYPFDGAKLAWGNAYDHWDCYRTSIKAIFGELSSGTQNVADVNYVLAECVKVMRGEEISEDASEIIQAFSEMDDMIESEGVEACAELFGTSDDSFYRTRFLKIAEFGGFLKMAQTYIDPKINGIQAHRINGAVWPPDDREVWTDYPCYFLRVD